MQTACKLIECTHWCLVYASIIFYFLFFFRVHNLALYSWEFVVLLHTKITQNQSQILNYTDNNIVMSFIVTEKIHHSILLQSKLYSIVYIWTKKIFKNVNTKDLGLPKKYGNKNISAMTSAYWMSTKSYGDLFYTLNHCLIFSY